MAYLAEQTRTIEASATIEGITAMIVKFYYGTAYTVNPDNLEINRVSDGKKPEGVRVVLKKNRYRFETI